RGGRQRRQFRRGGRRGRTRGRLRDRRYRCRDLLLAVLPRFFRRGRASRRGCRLDRGRVRRLGGRHQAIAAADKIARGNCEEHPEHHPQRDRKEHRPGGFAAIVMVGFGFGGSEHRLLGSVHGFFFFHGAILARPERWLVVVLFF